MSRKHLFEEIRLIKTQLGFLGSVVQNPRVLALPQDTSDLKELSCEISCQVSNLISRTKQLEEKLQEYVEEYQLCCKTARQILPVLEQLLLSKQIQSKILFLPELDPDYLCQIDPAVTESSVILIQEDSIDSVSQTEPPQTTSAQVIERRLFTCKIFGNLEAKVKLVPGEFVFIEQEVFRAYTLTISFP